MTTIHMEYMIPPLTAGILLGLLMGFVFLFKWRFSATKASKRMETEVALLQERLRNREETIKGMQGLLDEARLRIDRLRGEHFRESELRIKAEEKTHRLTAVEAELSEKIRQIALLHGENRALGERVRELEGRLEEQKAVFEEKFSNQKEYHGYMERAFKSLSTEIFQQNNRAFLDLARAALGEANEKARGELDLRRQSIEEVIQPLRDCLVKVDNHMRQIELDRTRAYAGLVEQVKSLATGQALLQKETAHLAKALRAPNTRGRWGELQLRRVVEMAGMVEYCDFYEQQSIMEEEKAFRPDMIVRLPGKTHVVIDSKVPLLAYLQAMETVEEEEKARKLREHALCVRNHMVRLGGKSYWEKLKPSPEFVILFLPGENFFSAALTHDPELIEFGVNRKVVLATPTTLIALLRAVSYGWRQERINDHAILIGELGQSLYERIRTMTAHFADLRKALERAVDSFNRTVGSLEGRVLVTARRFKEIDATRSDEIEAQEPLTLALRPVAPDA